MIRKFFAFIFLLIFIFAMPPMLILQSIDLSFLNKSSVEKNLIPQSYGPVTAMLAENLSANPADSALFAQRINSALPKETYVELMTAVSDTFFATLGKLENLSSIEINFEPLKARLKQKAPEIIGNLQECTLEESRREGFRFCKPRHMPAGQNLETLVMEILDKEVPQNYVIENKGAPEMNVYVRAAVLVEKYLPAIIAAIAVFILGLIALFVFSPLPAILKWLGAALLSLTFLLVFFLISVVKLPEVAPIFEGFSPARIDLIKFFAGQVISKLTFLTFFIGGGGILFLGSGIIIRKK